MSEIEISELENTIPALAVQALTTASDRALASGRSVVLVVDGQLVRIGPDGCTPLQSLPPRVRVSVRKKRAQT